MFTEKEALYYTAKAIDGILTCYNQGIKLPDILKHLEKIKEENGRYINPYVSKNSEIYITYNILLDNVSKFKKIIADFAGIDLNDVSLQPSINALKDAYDLDTAAAFNTKIYQLIASDIQDSKTNSALQQQLAALCKQVETLTGQVQQLSEQIQQLKNSPTKSE